MFKQDPAFQEPMTEWLDTRPRKQARARNWALYMARGMHASLPWFRGVLSPFGFSVLRDALRDTIYELEQQYPDSPGPKTISKRSNRNA